MRHIINLIAKSFLFDNKSKNFETNIVIVNGINNLKWAIKL